MEPMTALSLLSGALGGGTKVNQKVNTDVSNLFSLSLSNVTGGAGTSSTGTQSATSSQNQSDPADDIAPSVSPVLGANMLDDPNAALNTLEGKPSPFNGKGLSIAAFVAAAGLGFWALKKGGK